MSKVSIRSTKIENNIYFAAQDVILALYKAQEKGGSVEKFRKLLEETRLKSMMEL